MSLLDKENRLLYSVMSKIYESLRRIEIISLDKQQTLKALQQTAVEENGPESTNLETEIDQLHQDILEQVHTANITRDELQANDKKLISKQDLTPDEIELIATRLKESD